MNIGKNHWNWKGGGIKKICQICKIEFDVVHSRRNVAKFCSNKCARLYLKGVNHWHWTKQRFSRECLQCGKIINLLPERKDTQKFCNAKCYGLWQRINRLGRNSPTYGRKIPEHIKKYLSLLNRGSNSPLWKGGRKTLKQNIRNTEHYKKWRFAIFRRDGFACVLCGNTKKYFNADHIKPMCIILDERNIKTVEDARKCEELWDISNGRTLCIDCHKGTETFGWKVYNAKIIKKRLDKINGIL